MAKKKSAPKHVEPEEESQEVPEEQEGGGQEGHGFAPGESGLSKAEAIRRVMADGIDNPSLGSQEIKKRFDLDVTPQHFSATKANFKKAQAAEKPKGKPGRKPKEAPSQAVEGYLAPPPKQAPTGGEAGLIEALEAMKPLVASLGADKVKRLVDLLG